MQQIKQQGTKENFPFYQTLKEEVYEPLEDPNRSSVWSTAHGNNQRWPQHLQDDATHLINKTRAWENAYQKALSFRLSASVFL